MTRIIASVPQDRCARSWFVSRALMPGVILDPPIKSQRLFKQIRALRKTNTVKPASSAQWVSSDLSNPTGITVGKNFRSILRAILCALPLLGLNACAPRYSSADWSPFVSKQATMKFVAQAVCGIPSVFNPVAADASFFEIISLEPVAGQPWRFDVVYLTAAGRRQDQLDIKQWWSAAGKSAAPSSAWRENQHCAVIAELPQSADAVRPYFLEPPVAKKAEYETLSTSAVLIFLGLFPIFLIALLPSIWGFATWEWWGAMVAYAGTILLVALIGMYLCVLEPWQTFQKTLEYYHFFDGLPRADGRLLPMPAHYLYYLMAGPPHPDETKFAFAPFATITVTLAGIWLIAIMPFIVKGLYWLTHPLPLQKVHKLALREGRRPTADEITAAVMKASAGKSTWQLNIMRRKAERFARKLSGIAQYL